MAHNTLALLGLLTGARAFGPSPGPSLEKQIHTFNQLITQVEVDRAGDANPNVAFWPAQKDAVERAGQCTDMRNLELDYSMISDQQWCLQEICESKATFDECNGAFYLGCAFCEGKCVVAGVMHAAVTQCIRDAYADADPGKVNGQVPAGVVIPSTVTTQFYGMSGVYTGGQVRPGGVGTSAMVWGSYQNSRPPGYRVPIHVHPLGGLQCVNEGPLTLMVEGKPDVTYTAGECVNMPAFTKMTQRVVPGRGGYLVTDTFNSHSCMPTWIVVEPAAYHVQDAQFGVPSDIACPARPDDS